MNIQLLTSVIKYKFLWLILFSLFTTFSQAQFIISSDNQPNQVSLHPYTFILKTNQENLTLNQVQKIDSLSFDKVLNENMDLGFTNDHYWLKFSIKNETNEKQLYFLEACRPIVDIATLYQIKLDGIIVKQFSGDAIPFSQRSVQNRKTVFKINLESNQEYTFYLHLKSDGEVINAGLTLRSVDNLMQTIAFEQVIFGLFYGILIIAAILYIFFFFAIKERSFLYYSLYVVFIGMLQFSLDGYFYQFFTPSSGWLSQNAVILFACIANFFLGRYAQVFLKVKSYNNFINKAFYFVFVLDLILFISLFISPQALEIAYPIANLLGLILLSLIIASIVVIYKKTGTIDRFFTFGIVSLIVGFVIFILKNFSVLPVTFLTENSSKIGTGIEVVFLSLSMANLIKRLRDDKEKLQEVALQRLTDMNEMKTYFLSNISHELRTPLNAIINLSKEIARESKDDHIQKNGLLIKDSSYSLLSAVNDILDFSKIEKGEIKLDKAEFNPKELIQHIATNMAYRAKSQGIGFNIDFPSSMPQLILGDKMRLTQMLNNVLSNALKFTAQGFVNFKVETISKDNIQMDFIFSISDTGVGIPKEKMDSIFESFTQESITNKRKFGGLGLGLYIVKTLADLHKGTVNLQSIVNQGTYCKITLPYEVAEVKPIVETILSTITYDLNGKRILVVEDNAMNQMVIKMITKKWLNTEVIYANNGLEALTILKEKQFDLILMDLQMPVMDGYEATIAIRNGQAGENYRNIPIIALTADVMETTKEKVFEIGMNNYMTKPIDKELLYTNVLALL